MPSTSNLARATERLCLDLPTGIHQRTGAWNEGTAMPRKSIFAAVLALIFLAAGAAGAPPATETPVLLPLVEKVEAQPLLAQARRVAEAMDYLGSPLSNETK